MNVLYICLLLSLFSYSAGESSTSWTAVGNGVHYRNYGFGPGVLIMYAEWSVSSTLSQHWVDRIMQQRNAVTVLKNVGHVYAVQGPREVQYTSAEIENSKLVKHLLALPITTPERVLVAAHSSGAFVANEFFSQFYGPNGDTTGKFNGKVFYFNLDGAGGLPVTASAKVKQYFVYAKAGPMNSMNAKTMMSLGNGQNTIVITGDESGCFTSKCLHDLMINQHPWDSFGIDLEKDYGLFSLETHEVQFYYLTWLSSHLPTS